MAKIKHFTLEEINCAEKSLQLVLVTKSIYFLKIDHNKSRILLKTVLSLLNMNEFSNKEFKNKILTVISNIILDDSLYKMYG